MKKIMLTMALAAFFTTGIVDNADAWIFSRKNATTMEELTNNFGSNFVTEEYKGSDSYALYGDWKNLKSTYKTVKKNSKLSGDKEKIFSQFLDYMEKALVDIYQSEKPATLLKKANKVCDYYNANQSDIDNFVEEKLKTTSFGNQLKTLSIPQLEVENASGETAVATKNVLDVITSVQNVLTAEERAAAEKAAEEAVAKKAAAKKVAAKKAAEEAAAVKAAEEAAAAKKAAEEAAAVKAAEKAARRRALL